MRQVLSEPLTRSVTGAVTYPLNNTPYANKLRSFYFKLEYYIYLICLYSKTLLYRLA
jgi:hypothetical protein